MAGRAGFYDETTEGWTDIVYMPTTAENDFCPALPETPVDLIYLCSPNNPTGTVLTYDQLKAWVDYANEHGSVILFDAAYERFIVEEGVPHSIFEVEGAKTCAIEFPLVLQNSRLHGRTLRLHRGAEGARARWPESQRHVEPPPDDQV